MSKQFIALLFAGTLTIGAALLHGRFSNRWDTPASLDAAGRQLDELPREIGSWKNSEDMRPLSTAVCRELGLVGHFHRQYKHVKSGHRLDVLLMVGAPGRLVRHPPELCYANRANQRLGDAEELEVQHKSGTHRFKILKFKRVAQPIESEFTVAYAYAEEEATWSTPGSPRMAYGAQPVLYKLQVLSDLPAVKSSADIEDFLAQFVDAFPAATLHSKNLEAAGVAKEQH